MTKTITITLVTIALIGSIIVVIRNQTTHPFKTISTKGYTLMKNEEATQWISKFNYRVEYINNSYHITDTTGMIPTKVIKKGDEIKIIEFVIAAHDPKGRLWIAAPQKLVEMSKETP